MPSRLSFVQLNIFTIFILSWYIILVNSNPLPAPTALDNDIVSKGSVEQTCKRREYYHNETQACYKHMTKGPCKGNMLFLKLDKTFGDCDCSENEPVPWVYHPATNDCYATYKQSYCAVDEWLTFDDSRKPTCVSNPCKGENSLDEDHPTVFFNNKCVPVKKPSDPCGPAEEVGFKTWDVIPECISTLAEQSVIGLKQLKCRPGTRRDSNGTCRRTIMVAVSED